MNKKLLNDLKKDIYQVVNDYRGYLIQKCRLKLYIPIKIKLDKFKMLFKE